MMDYRQNKGYAEVETKERDNFEREDYTAQNEYANVQNIYANAKNVNNQPQIDDLDALLYYKPQETSAVARPTAVPAPKARGFEEADDCTPSQETMRYQSATKTQPYGTSELENKKESQVFIRHYDELEPYEDYEEDKQYSINTKGKVLIAVYAIVVLTIFALIIMNTSLLNNMNNDVAMLQYRIEQLQQQRQELSEELDFVSSDEEIIRKAEELGMIK